MRKVEVWEVRANEGRGSRESVAGEVRGNKFQELGKIRV